MSYECCRNELVLEPTLKSTKLWDQLIIQAVVYSCFESMPGSQRFVRKKLCNAGGVGRWKRSFSWELFRRFLQRLVPAIRPEDLGTGGAGVRAQAMAHDGEILQDFCLIARPHALYVLSAPIPAATASLALGAKIAGMVERDGQSDCWGRSIGTGRQV